MRRNVVLPRRSCRRRARCRRASRSSSSGRCRWRCGSSSEADDAGARVVRRRGRARARRKRRQPRRRRRRRCPARRAASAAAATISVQVGPAGVRRRRCRLSAWDRRGVERLDHDDGGRSSARVDGAADVAPPGAPSARRGRCARSARPGRLRGDPRRVRDADHVRRLGRLVHAQRDPQVRVRADVLADDAARALRREQQVDAEAAAALGDVDDRRRRSPAPLARASRTRRSTITRLGRRARRVARLQVGEVLRARVARARARAGAARRSARRARAGQVLVEVGDEADGVRQVDAVLEGRAALVVDEQEREPVGRVRDARATAISVCSSSLLPAPVVPGDERRAGRRARRSTRERPVRGRAERTAPSPPLRAPSAPRRASASTSASPRSSSSVDALGDCSAADAGARRPAPGASASASSRASSGSRPSAVTSSTSRPGARVGERQPRRLAASSSTIAGALARQVAAFAAEPEHGDAVLAGRRPSTSATSGALGRDVLVEHEQHVRPSRLRAGPNADSASEPPAATSRPISSSSDRAPSGRRRAAARRRRLGARRAAAT